MKRKAAALVLAIGCLAALGCTSVRTIRVQNVSDRNLSNVRIADQQFGDIAAGQTTPYRDVTLKARYASMEMTIDGKYVTAQSLNFGSKRFTYEIDIKDFDKGHLKIKLVRDK